jgi:two-component system response regulator MprA
MRTLISRALQIAGYHTEQAASGIDALQMLGKQEFALMILDLRMPEMDGIEVMRRVRDLDIDTDIIVLTAAPSIESAIMAVRAGAADYLQKPITTNELIDTISKTLNKRQTRLQKERIEQALNTELGLGGEVLLHLNFPKEITLGDLYLDRSQQTFMDLKNENQKVNLTRGETAVLSSLMVEPERVFSCAELARIAWGYSLSEEEAQSIIRPYISRLRQKLEPENRVPQLIVTVRGSGYFFDPPQQLDKKVN